MSRVRPGSRLLRRQDRQELTASPAWLKVRGVSKHYGPLQVLDSVSLEVRPGELVALVGENGAGKSTLVKCIAGVLPADVGQVLLDSSPLGGGPTSRRAAGLAVVWQDLSLCDNLDGIANLFLGRERWWLHGEDDRRTEVKDLFARLGVDPGDTSRPVGMLSGGQRQLIAMARALLDNPRLLILDEPTASLGVHETRGVVRLIHRLRAEGKTILLVSHDLDEVFELADRIVVLRQGRVVETVSPREVHREDVVALMTGAEVGSTARRQLERLESLVDQLSESEPAASLPLIVSAMAAALDHDMLSLHLREGGERPGLRLAAAIGLPTGLVHAIRFLEMGEAGGPAGLAVTDERVVVVEDTRHDPFFGAMKPSAASLGALSAWAAPVAGPDGVIGAVTGFGGAVAPLTDDQRRLVALYASHAAAAIERERLLDEVTGRNRLLETLRLVLEILAGPDQLRGGLSLALVALCRGLDADAVALELPGAATLVVGVEGAPPAGTGAALSAMAAELLEKGLSGRAQRAGPAGVGAVIEVPGGRAVLSATWGTADRIGPDAVGLIGDAGRSLQLAIEREALQTAQQEADAARRSQAIQREFLIRLSHELRTPLTAIQGYVSTLRQPDVSWDGVAQNAFLDRIATESARLARLVGDLLDSSAIEAGILRLDPDWCDLALVVKAAISCLPPRAAGAVRVSEPAEVVTVWADHDRLEQVFVNLIDNAVRHTPEGTLVSVGVEPVGQGWLRICIADEGPGIPEELAARIFEPYQRGVTEASGAGLGLAIAKGIVEAHGGELRLLPAASGTIFEILLPTDPPDSTG